jgi:HK97 family phage prohead protease
VKTKTRAPKIATVDGREIRTFASRLEASNGAGPLEFRVTGYASTFEDLYDMGAYDEVVARGAFTQTLAGRPDVQLLTNHEGLPLARTTIPPGQVGHLSLSEDYRGLRVDAQLDREDPDAVTLVKKIRAGLLDQMSFAFKVTKQTWSDDCTLRTIQAVDINRGDVSVVNQGANDATSVDARSRGRRGRGVSLATYQARARALQLRDLQIRNKAGRRR